MPTLVEIGVLFEQLARRKNVPQRIGYHSARCCARRACQALRADKLDDAATEAFEAARRNPCWADFRLMVDAYIKETRNANR